jgi:hypothetical protein
MDAPAQMVVVREWTIASDRSPEGTYCQPDCSRLVLLPCTFLDSFQRFEQKRDLIGEILVKPS